MKNMRQLSNMQKPLTYEFRVKGVLDQKWSDWFGNFTIKPQPDGETRLTGQITDQAALRGILSQILNLNIELISVTKMKDKHKLH